MLKAEDYLSGQVLLIDKSLHWTSFQVVNKLRWEIRQAFKIKKIKVGHAGTLDPLATGLLILCTGKFTKLIDQYQAQEKEYTGNFKLGSTTPSYDLETEISSTFNSFGTQIVKSSSSSATLLNQENSEFILYEGAVTIDPINGFSGTTAPIGTTKKPSNNLTDAIIIANNKYLHALLQVIGFHFYQR